jgi:hypothetical protein
VIVVDEAAQIGGRQMDQLLQLAGPTPIILKMEAGIDDVTPIAFHAKLIPTRIRRGSTPEAWLMCSPNSAHRFEVAGPNTSLKSSLSACMNKCSEHQRSVWFSTKTLTAVTTISLSATWVRCRFAIFTTITTTRGGRPDDDGVAIA